MLQYLIVSYFPFPAKYCHLFWEPELNLCIMLGIFQSMLIEMPFNDFNRDIYIKTCPSYANDIQVRQWIGLLFFSV